MPSFLLASSTLARTLSPAFTSTSPVWCAATKPTTSAWQSRFTSTPYSFTSCTVPSSTAPTARVDLQSGGFGFASASAASSAARSVSANRLLRSPAPSLPTTLALRVSTARERASSTSRTCAFTLCPTAKCCLGSVTKVSASCGTGARPVRRPRKRTKHPASDTDATCAACVVPAFSPARSLGVAPAAITSDTLRDTRSGTEGLSLISRTTTRPKSAFGTSAERRTSAATGWSERWFTSRSARISLPSGVVTVTSKVAPNVGRVLPMRAGITMPSSTPSSSPPTSPSSPSFPAVLVKLSASRLSFRRELFAESGPIILALTT
mmetsp:Transcript_34917/g.58678  ORF Transcript_34917/g.58678 Transcript_34917/m.58678 type:complete len:322 (-) Transcript_34917:2047-3012(-)